MTDPVSYEVRRVQGEEEMAEALRLRHDVYSVNLAARLGLGTSCQGRRRSPSIVTRRSAIRRKASG